jgi:hypothetical protein
MLDVCDDQFLMLLFMMQTKRNDGALVANTA